jgi:hypothetical protein
MKKNKLSNLQNVFFFFSFLCRPFLLSNLITFLFLIHYKQFKMLQERHLKFYKSSLNSNSNIQERHLKFYKSFLNSNSNIQRIYWMFGNQPFAMFGGLFF